MAWDHYFIGHGAQHSAEIMRLMPYMIFGAQEGVFTRTDCEVQALPTPGGAVNVMPGAAAILNRTPGYAMQMYLSRLPTAESVTVNPTDSAGPRSDLVVIRVEDPLPGTPWQLPGDPATDPYIFTRVIENVDPNTTSATQLGTSDSMYALARIDIPASTATVTQDMIVDLRTVSNPLTGVGGTFEKQWTSTLVPASASLVKSGTAGTQFTTFPANATWSVPIPAWATEVDTLVLTSPYMVNSSWGFARLQIAGSTPASTWIDDDTVPGQGGERTSIMITGTQPIPAEIRGTTATVNFQMRVSEQASDGVGWRTGPGTPLYVSLNFKQKPTTTAA